MVQVLLFGYLLGFVCLYNTWLAERSVEISLDVKLLASAIAFLPIFGPLFWWPFFRTPPVLQRDNVAPVAHVTTQRVIAVEMRKTALQKPRVKLCSQTAIPPLFIGVYRFCILPFVFLLVLMFNYLFWMSR